MWLPLVLVASPVGVVTGYGFTSVFLNNNISWEASFRIMSGIIIVSSAFFLFVPSKYIEL